MLSAFLWPVLVPSASRSGAGELWRWASPVHRAGELTIIQKMNKNGLKCTKIKMRSALQLPSSLHPIKCHLCRRRSRTQEVWRRWAGQIVEWYRAKLTPKGYAVESESHHGSVQIYPVTALERVA